MNQKPFTTLVQAVLAGVVASTLIASASVALAQSPPATEPARPAPPARPAAPTRQAPSRDPGLGTRPQQADPNLTLSPNRNDAQNAPSVGTSGGQEIEEPRPPIELDPPVCDFGFVKPASTPTKTVKIKNTSTEPLTILAVQPSCKCTTINDIVGTDIPPGGSIDLEASMKATSSPGGKKAEIKVLFDGYSRVVNIQLVMEVTLPVRVMPGYINSVRGQPQQGRIVVESLDKRPFTICSVHGRAPDLIGFDPAKDQPRNQYLLSYDVTKYVQGEMPLFLLIETDHPDCPVVDVRLRHEYTFPKPVLKMQDYRLTTGWNEQGTPGEILLEIGELPPDEPLVSVASSFPGVRMELEGAPELEGVVTKYKVKVTPPDDFTGILYAPITLYTTRRQQEMVVWGVYVPKGHKGCLGLMDIIPGTPAMRYTAGKSAASAAPAAPAEPAKTAAP